MSQAQVADAAGVGRSVVSLVEQGRLEETSFRSVRRIGSVLGISLPIEPNWRGAELAKLLDERHSVLVRAVIDQLSAHGWQALPEHTFNEWGERGSIDIFAWQAVRRAVLCLEVKTRLVDLQDLLSTEDRKRRLAPNLARRLGWKPLLVGSILVVPDETWARNAVDRCRSVFDAKFPLRTADVRRWLKSPDRDVGGIWFLVNAAPDGTKQRLGGVMRVRARRPPAETARSRSDSEGREA
jgi:transcriptional regulator with XRE-family HTH domain